MKGDIVQGNTCQIVKDILNQHAIPVYRSANRVRGAIRVSQRLGGQNG